MKRNYLRSAVLAVLGSLCMQPVGFCAELSLQDAICMALAENTSLRITQKAEDRAEAAWKKAQGSNAFSISLSDSLSTSDSSEGERNSSNNLGLSASLPIYTGGRNQASIESSRIGMDTAMLTTKRAQENMKLSVIKAYYDVLQSKQTVAVNKEKVEKYQAHDINVKQLYSAGSKAKVDMLRSSVELSDAKQQLIREENTYETRLAVLRNLLNIDRNEPLTLTDDFSYAAFPMEMQDCISYAFDHRKDLIVDEKNLEQKELGIKMAKAAYLPQVSVNAGLTLDNRRFEPSKDNSCGWSAGVRASWNIFDSGVTDAEVDTAETERDIAKLTLQNDRQSVDLSLRTSYYSMREAEKRLNSTKAAVKQAEEDCYIASEKYRAGEGIMLDVIDAQQALSTARLNYISAQYDYVRGKAEVENVMGVSLNETEQEATYKGKNTKTSESEAAK